MYEDYYAEIEAKLVGQTVNGVTITGQTAHFLERVFGCMIDPHTGRKRDGVELNELYDTVNNPYKIGNIKTDKNGERSFVVYCMKSSVSINPDTGKLIQTNRRGGK